MFITIFSFRLTEITMAQQLEHTWFGKALHQAKRWKSTSRVMLQFLNPQMWSYIQGPPSCRFCRPIRPTPNALFLFSVNSTRTLQGFATPLTYKCDMHLGLLKVDENVWKRVVKIRRLRQTRQSNLIRKVVNSFSLWCMK